MHPQSDNSSLKAKKGWLAVRVGLEEENVKSCSQFRRFFIPISHLKHPLFKDLLESARGKYGFHTSGLLKLPCSVDDFVHILCLIDQEAPHLYGLCGSRSMKHHPSNSSLDSF